MGNSLCTFDVITVETKIFIWLGTLQKSAASYKTSTFLLVKTNVLEAYVLLQEYRTEDLTG